jgi:D-alanyl-D-alanine dipeptidase
MVKSRAFAFIRFFLAFPFFAAAVTACASDLNHAVPINCRQLVLVTARDWSASSGMLRRYERLDGGTRWRPAGAPVEVLLGRHGLGWGVGLHLAPEKDGPRKVEGDERSPAGIFEFGTAFGRAAREDVPWVRMPYLRLSPATEAVDDPASRYYGHIVERDRAERPDWKSSEHMGRIPAYDLGVVVAHNPQHLPRAGSCIFLHLWMHKQDGTSGCTALHRADLVDLLRWLDPANHPVLVQLPAKVAHERLSVF